MFPLRPKLVASLLLLATLPPIANGGCGHIKGERHYCTQRGPIYLQFDGGQLAGVFADRENDRLGSLVGQIEGDVMTGRWSGSGAAGDVVIRFTPDRSAFQAEYRSDDSPSVWHREWRGVLRYADGERSFTLDDVEYRCE